jgi:hypothetical protein
MHQLSHLLLSPKSSTQLIRTLFFHSYLILLVLLPHVPAPGLVTFLQSGPEEPLKMLSLSLASFFPVYTGSRSTLTHSSSKENPSPPLKPSLLSVLPWHAALFLFSERQDTRLCHFGVPASRILVIQGFRQLRSHCVPQALDKGDSGGMTGIYIRVITQSLKRC